MSKATMSIHSKTLTRRAEVTMNSIAGDGRRGDGRQSGQILILATFAMIVMIAGVALLIDGGNAYAQQRAVQNGADAAANAGADVLAERLSGVAKTDADVHAAMFANAGLNSVSTTAYYTNVQGQPIDLTGAVVTASQAATVGNAANTIPSNAQGVHNGGSRTFGTSFARAIGIDSLVASAEAIAITGRLIGGQFLPVVFPINITDCSQNGSLGTAMADWGVSGEPVPPSVLPDGQEWIVPLCKTGGGSFMILDWDNSPNDCVEDVTNPPAIEFPNFPADVPSDNGNNCANLMVDAVNKLQGQTVLVPICDSACVTNGGTNAIYHIVGIRGFYIDYMSDTNNQNNPACQSHTANGQSLITIAGNGSSSCLVGWFVTPLQTGTVGTGPVDPGDAIGIQLIK
jgi:Flp pilus assembly protein TadG